MMKTRASGSVKSELRGALAACSGAFFGIGAFSGLINVLMLTGSLFMLEVYDRVLPSRSVPTLIALSVLAAILFTFQGLLDITRGRLLVRIGNQLHDRVGARAFDAVVRARTKPGGDGQQPVRDLDTVRSFLSGPGPTALFDLPWIPLYLAICFAFHTLIGVTAVCGAVVLVGLTLVTEFLSRHPVKAASTHAAARNRIAEASRRNAEVVTAMGMSERLLARCSTLDATISPSRNAPTTSRPGWARPVVCCAPRSNRWCSPSGPIWSSNRRPRRGSSSPARS
jgi:ABC-type protease/lipase transport system fused ATPase/permease subunit